MTVDVSDLSTRGRSFLRMMGVIEPADLRVVRPTWLWPQQKYKNVGKKTARELIWWARRHGYEFADGVPGVPRARPRCPTCGKLWKRSNRKAAEDGL